MVYVASAVVSLESSDRFSVACCTTEPGGMPERSNFMRIAFATSLSGHVYVISCVDVLWLVESRLRDVSCGTSRTALLATATATLADVVMLPAASLATAVSVWLPSVVVVVSHEAEY